MSGSDHKMKRQNKSCNVQSSYAVENKRNELCTGFICFSTTENKQQKKYDALRKLIHMRSSQSLKKTLKFKKKNFIIVEYVQGCQRILVNFFQV